MEAPREVVQAAEGRCEFPSLPGWNGHTVGGHEWSWQGAQWNEPIRELKESTELTEDERGRIWEEARPAGSCVGTGKMFKWDDKGAYTEDFCYECWASTATDPSPEGSLQARKSTSNWRYMCLEDMGLFEKDAWEFLMGTHADAVSRSKSSGLRSPRSVRLRNRGIVPSTLMPREWHTLPCR